MELAGREGLEASDSGLCDSPSVAGAPGQLGCTGLVDQAWLGSGALRGDTAACQQESLEGPWQDRLLCDTAFRQPAPACLWVGL